MAHIRNRVAVAVLTAVCSLLVPATAQAIVVGPGDPIRMPTESSPKVGNRYVGSVMASGGIAGTVTDHFGETHRVVLTAGHCLLDSPASGLPAVTGEVYAPTAQGDQHIGTAGAHRYETVDLGPMATAAGFNGADYGVIMLDPDVETTSMSYSADENGRSHGEPVQMTGIKDYPDLQPGVISIDNLGQPICEDGSRTGRGCGVQLFRARYGVWAYGLGMDHGDSGGNAYDPRTNEVIGINSMVVGPISRVQPADIALEEAFGIPDGEVNQNFKVSEPTERDTDYRTVNEDAAADTSYYEQQQGTSQGDQLPAIDNAVPNRVLAPLIPQLVKAASQASIPVLSESSELSGLLG